MPTAPRITQRAYTLRLSSRDGADLSPLWQTHRAVNAGTNAFGDWLLTCRGGLDHRLVEASVREKRGQRPPTEAERRSRRVLLGLSWLSVETRTGAPAQYIVASTTEPASTRWHTVEALVEILLKRGMGEAEVAVWVADCAPSLTAAINDGAVWVNRSAAFDGAVARVGSSLTREEVWDLLEPVPAKREGYLAMNGPAPEDDDASDGAVQEVPARTGSARANDLAKSAGQWLSTRFGSGAGTDFGSLAAAYAAIATWAKSAAAPLRRAQFEDQLCAALAGFDPVPGDLDGVEHILRQPGPRSTTRRLLAQLAAAPSVTERDLENLEERARNDAKSADQKIGRKGHRIWSDALLRDVENACGFAYQPGNGDASRHWEFAVMLDHAGRRVSALHSWIKLAEQRRWECDADAQRMANVPGQARAWLDTFCADRTDSSGALKPYRIRRRAHQGWARVVEQWSAAGCYTEHDRIAAVRARQADPELKFGDIKLFEALAADDAVCVWGDPSAPRPQILLDYAAATKAAYDRRRYKVPAYCHPDPLLHPVFCDFGNSRWSITFAAHKRPTEMDLRHRVTLRLFTGSTLANTEVLWHSKRFTADMALRNIATAPVGQVTRADRLGRAVAGAGEDQAVEIRGIFGENEWNGRLQAPRKTLRAIAAVRDNPRLSEENKRARIDQLLARLPWYISFSPRLRPAGPWIDYTAANGIKLGCLYKDANRNRTGQARLILAKLPGLRVLSVDLGRRYAAAAAVWQTVTAADVERVCKQAGAAPPGPEALYLRLKVDGKVTTFRRTGEEMWARLDRQFLIKLAGEDEDARKASPAEVDQVVALEQELGYIPEETPTQVDKLMRFTLRMLRLGLRRHATAARIAGNLGVTHVLLASRGEEQRTTAASVDLLVTTLAEWHRLAHSTRWQAAAADQLWDEHIAPLLEDAVLPNLDAAATPHARRKANEELRAALRSPAECLAGQDNTGLQRQWLERWRAEDARWPCRIRTIRRWVLPPGRIADSPEIRHVGGMSLLRLENIRKVYELQKVFFTRAVPQRHGPGVVTGLRFADRTLQALKHLRENRVKQLSSRIAAAALGLDKDLRPHTNDQRFRPCHAVVIEELSDYGPDQTRKLGENRRLMGWCAARVKKYLGEACELYGLYLRPVWPAYTTQQDWFTGAPGIRCQDMFVDNFLDPAGPWAREISAARKPAAGEGSRRYLIEVQDRLQAMPSAHVKRLGWVRVPKEGGAVFVSADPASPGARGIQADLNAAANIGLRALSDPDWAGKWWYVPCEGGTFEPLEKSTKGAAALSARRPLKFAPGERNRMQSSQPVNLWHDISTASLYGRKWLTYGSYRQNVERRAIEVLRADFGRRVRCIGADESF